jgi:hypothetical protein
MAKRRWSVVAAVVVMGITTVSPGRVNLKESNKTPSQSDEPLFRIWDDSGKEGFIDARGHVVIAPVFDTVTAFHEGLAPVEKDGKWGYIDRTGQMIISAQYRYAGYFVDGLAPVADNEHVYGGTEYGGTLMSCGFIDKTGRYVIEPSSERRGVVCTCFKEGLMPMCEQGGCGYLDRTGQWAIKPQFLFSRNSGDAAFFSEGLAAIALREFEVDNNESGLSDFAYIDKTGKTVFQLKGFSRVFPFRNGLAKVVRVRRWKLGRKTRIATTVGFIDRTGRIKFKFENTRIADPDNYTDPDLGKVFEDDIDEFYEGRARIKDPRTKRYGYIDLTGRWVIPPKYVEAGDFSEGLASVCTYEQTKCAYIDHQGRVILKMSSWGSEFHDGLALQYLFTTTISERGDLRNGEGYMNKAGKYVWVSPGGEYAMTKEWWRENYVGTTRKLSDE